MLRLALLLAVTSAGVAGCTSLLGISEPSGGAAADDAGAPDAAIASFSVAFDPPQARVVRGQGVFRTVRATRQAGFTGAIEVTFTNLPAMVTASPVTIAAGMDTGNVQLSSESNAALGLSGATLHAVAGDEQHDFPVALMIGDAPGALDLSFAGGTGVYTAAVSALPTAARALALQSDGKIIVVGDGGVILRLDTNGVVDPSFGTSGSVDTDDNSMFGVAIGANDTIYTVGNNVPVVARVRKFDADGTPVDGFGIAGVAPFPDQAGFAIAVDDFGNVLVATSDSDSYNIQRLHPDGQPDTSFAGTGVLVSPGYLFGMSARPDLTFVGTGNIVNGADTGASLLSGTADGFLDPAFGGDGLIAMGVEGDIGFAVAFAPDGGVVVTGVANYNVGTLQVFAGRVLADGTPDPAFGTGGVVRRDFGGPGAEGYGVGLQADGRIVIGVTGNESKPGGSPTVAGVMRLFANGSPDPSFAGGAPTLTVPGATAAADVSVNGLVIQPDGRIIVAGGCSETGWVVARVWD